MPAVGGLARRAKAVRPVAEELRRAQRSASEGGLIGVLPGDIPTADALRELLGAPSTDLPRGEGLLVHPAVEGADTAGPARALLAHEEAGGRSLALLIGAREQRERLERAFVEAGLRVASIAH
ncbi:MAG: hypothetical protein QOK40_1342, partial [Miltoncostaeaceae bacterium]|nr:hypothetical protein [Miltoncostaeaceae bacterium]